jgi:hypothetical protein
MTFQPTSKICSTRTHRARTLAGRWFIKAKHGAMLFYARAPTLQKAL